MEEKNWKNSKIRRTIKKKHREGVPALFSLNLYNIIELDHHIFNFFS